MHPNKAVGPNISLLALPGEVKLHMLSFLVRFLCGESTCQNIHERLVLLLCYVIVFCGDPACSDSLPGFVPFFD